MSNPRSATAFRLPPEMHDRLKAAAEERGLPMNFLVVRAIGEFLDDLLPPQDIVLTRRHQTGAVPSTPTADWPKPSPVSTLGTSA